MLVFAGANPVQQNDWTTNLASALPRSTNVPTLSGNQTFSGNNTFSNGIFYKGSALYGSSDMWVGAHNFDGNDTIFPDANLGLGLFGESGKGGCIVNSNGLLTLRWTDSGVFYFSNTIYEKGIPVLTNVSSAAISAAGGVTTNMVQTLYSDTNALYFCNVAGISDLDSRRAIVGFVNELRAANLWQYVADAAFFYPRFNPTNGLTLMGRSITYSNATFGQWGLSMTNSFTKIIGLPDLRTNTQIYDWHVPDGWVDGGTPNRFLGGLVNTNANQALIFCGNGAAGSAARIRVNGAENDSNNGQGSWFLVWNSLNQYAFNNPTYQMAAGNKIISAFSYDGSNITVFQDYFQVKIDHNNPTFSTNYALSGLQISVPLTNLYLGTDYTNKATIGKAESDCAAVLLLTTNINLAQWKAIHKAMRWLETEDDDFVFLGDSTAVEQYGTFSGTNSPYIFIKNSGTLASKNNVNTYAIGGDFYNYYTPYSSTTAANYYTNKIAVFSLDYIPQSKVKKRTFVMQLGINDIYNNDPSGNVMGTQILTNVFTVADMARTNGISLYVTTIPETATNGSVYSQRDPYNGYRTNFNALIVSNAFRFAGIIRRDLLFNQTVLATNANSFTVDGTHMGGNLGYVINQRIANAELGFIDRVKLSSGGGGEFDGGSLTNLNLAMAVGSIPTISPKTPVAVSLTGSAFTFSNATPSILECYFSGSVAYAVTKNGVGVFGSLAADGYFQLQPTNQCVITYTVAPTFYTNALY